MRPLARRDGLVVRDLADETLVYDREHHQAHCLNHTAGIVFRHCDGTRSLEEIASLLGTPADAALSAGPRPLAESSQLEETPQREALVEAALRQLAAAHLLVDGDVIALAPVPAAPAEAVVPRRELLRRVGAALLVPAVATIVAPTPAQAASACVSGFPACDGFTPCSPCDPGGGSNCSLGYYCEALSPYDCLPKLSSGCP